MKNLVVSISIWTTTLFPISEYVMRIKNIHFDTMLQTCIENDEIVFQQYI